MTNRLYHLPVVWMAVVVFACAFLVTGKMYGVVRLLATGERARTFKAMSPVMTFFTLGVAACVVLIASHNRPFTGEISVGPELLLQVIPKE